MKAVVVALGKIGLPLAVQIAGSGHDVVGCDIDPRVCDAVNAGEPPFPGEEGLAERLSDVLAAGRLRAQTDTTAAVAEGPELVVAVPPLSIDDAGVPAYAALDAVADAIGAGLRPATTVSLETTVPVGTTRGRFAVRLARASELEAEAPDGFLCAFSPERVSSGRAFRDLATYPKLVGGLGPRSEERAVELYRQFLDAEVWPMGGAETAELAKLAETLYRHLNIAFANELARYADREGLDVLRAIEAANSQPFSHLHQPGVAVGGHCIPVYPHFHLQGDPGARLPRAADEINRSMPAHALELLAAEAGDLAGRRVLILGVAYRGGVKETAFSGAFALRDDLVRRGAQALAADPLYDASELEALGFAPWDGAAVDAAVVQADHAEYASLGPDDLPGVRAIVDGRGILDTPRFAAAGIAVRRIGRPS